MADTMIEDNDLGGLIQAEISRAVEYRDSDFGEDASLALEYMNGEVNDISSTPNGSRAVSRDFPDAVAWTLPGLVATFVGSGRMVEYEPVDQMRPEQEARRDQAKQAMEVIQQQMQQGGGAEIPPGALQQLQAIIDEPTDDDISAQATDYANYVFFVDNNGYELVYNACYDALVTGDAFIEHYWDDTPNTEVTNHSGLDEVQLAELMETEGVEVLSHDVETDEETGAEVYSVKIERETDNGRLVYGGIRHENFLADSDADRLSDARFAAVRYEDKTKSDLIEMGFDREVVDGLSTDQSNTHDNEETQAREEIVVGGTAGQTKSMEIVDLYKCFIKADVDDDGIAEMIKVWYVGGVGGGEVLKLNGKEHELWEDDLPFSKIPCYPVAHRLYSESLGDRSMDVMRTKTQLLRLSLDNSYASGMPMKEAEAGSVLNPDILVSPRLNGIIWKKKNTPPINRHETPFTADKTFLAMSQMDEVLKNRGIGAERLMALNADVLSNQTATASNNTKEAANSQVALIARNMANYDGWTNVFRQTLKLIVKHQDRSRTVRIHGEFVKMDPSSWSANMHARVNVGLGTGSKDRDIAALQGIQSTQVAMADRLAATGFSAQAIDFIPKILKTAEKLVEATGVEGAEDYFPDIDDEEIDRMKKAAAQKAQKPDPAMELEKQKHADDMELKQTEAQAAVLREQAQMEADLQVEQAKLQSSAALDQQKLASTERMKAAEIESNERIKAAEIEARASSDDMRFEIERAKLGIAAKKADNDTTNKANGGTN